MKGNKKTQTSLSHSKTPGEIGEFWDTHSLADYWDNTHEVEFEVTANRRKRVIVDPLIYKELESEARVRGIVPETLVNLWLAEKLHPTK